MFDDSENISNLYLNNLILEKTNKQSKQKDWIVYDFDKNNLFCIAIESKDGGENWKLIEYVNFFDLPDKKMQEMVSSGYQTMFVAKNKQDEYEWIIADHKFSKEDFEKKEYWKTLIPKNKLFGFVSLNVEIDKSQFEKEMKSLVKKNKFSGK